MDGCRGLLSSPLCLIGNRSERRRTSLNWTLDVMHRAAHIHKKAMTLSLLAKMLENRLLMNGIAVQCVMSTYGRWQVYNWNSREERENTRAWVRVMVSCHCQKNNWSVIDSSRIGQTQKRARMISETRMKKILLSNASEKIKHPSNDCCCFVCLH